MMRCYAISMLFCAVVLLIPVSTHAQHSIPNDVLAGGGGQSNAGGLYLHDTVGQPVIGATSVTSARIMAGYWYVVDGLHIGPTSEVTFAAFEAAIVEDGVWLRWEIGSASDLKGFHIYRSDKEQTDYERLTQSLLPPGGKCIYVDENLQTGRTYWYRIGALDRDGEFLSPAVKVDVPMRETTLYQNYPNPFNPGTTISFYLPESERVVLTIYDIRGRCIRRLIDERREYGRHRVSWNGRNNRDEPVGSGVYLYRLRTGNRTLTRKMILLR